MERVIGKRFRLAAGKAQDGEALDASRPRLDQRIQNIRRIAAAGKGNEDVARIRHGRELQGIYVVIADIVRETGEDGRIGSQRMATDAGTFLLRYRIEEVIGHMDGIAGAAAIADPKDLRLVLPAIEQGLA